MQNGAPRRFLERKRGGHFTRSRAFTLVEAVYRGGGVIMKARADAFCLSGSMQNIRKF